jgi:uncharacterized membrane protein YsdA (DUF1294 family)
MNGWIEFAVIIVLWNVIAFALYGADKQKARKQKQRISEATLILCAFLMGGAGALLGMSVFRHKTRHFKFKLLVPIAFILNIVIVVLILCHFDIMSLWK